MMGASPHPTGDSVVKHAPSRHRGLDVTVFAPRRGPAFRAYVHTPGWERILVVSTGASADEAIARGDALLTHAVEAGVDAHLPSARRPLRLQTAGEASD